MAKKYKQVILIPLILFVFVKPNKKSSFDRDYNYS